MTVVEFLRGLAVSVVIITFAVSSLRVWSWYLERERRRTARLRLRRKAEELRRKSEEYRWNQKKLARLICLDLQTWLGRPCICTSRHSHVDEEGMIH